MSQVPFQQRATLESHRRRCSGIKLSPMLASSSTTGVGISATLSPDEPTKPTGPLSLESTPSKPQTIILPNLNVTSPIPRKYPNLHRNSQAASNPKASPAGPSACSKHLGGDGDSRQNCETTTKNALHYLGFKYLASSKVLSSGQTAMDSNDLAALPKAELC